VKGALGAFAEIEFPIPVPRPKAYLSAREAFLYLVLFSCLYYSALSLVTLVFQLINLAFRDLSDLRYSVRYSDWALRWSVASLIVAFPIFLYVSGLVARAVRRDPRKRASRVRIWLTYMTLFVAAGVIIGALTGVLYRFLGGEITIRFLLKALTVGVIAGVLFGYYLWDLRREELETKA
jgi:hypothetical protein